MLIAHITDTHIKAPGRLAYGRVDTASMLAEAVVCLQRLEPQPDLLVITGDLVDAGRAEEYEHLKQLLSPLRMPMLVVAGNHDERNALRAAFPDHAHLQGEGFVQFIFEDERFPVRFIGLDTVVPGEGRGELCKERLAWLESELSRRPDQPTVVLMHHPPFLTGIGHMDELGLTGRDEFASILARHPQVELVLCGHLHRNIQARTGGRVAMTGPSTAHQVALDLRADAPSRFRMEPPGFLLHRWDGAGFVTHQATVGDYPGPYPFFDESGALID